MKTRRKTYSDDRRRLTVKKKSDDIEANSGLIPIDLLYEILCRVPAKSLARFRCVSKFWSTIPRSQHFSELLVTKSLNQPRLIFAVETDDDKKLSFFSSFQPEDPDEFSEDLVAVNPLMSVPFDSQLSPFYYHPPVHGFICLKHRFSNGKKQTVLMVTNLTTGQSLLLPRVKTCRIGVYCHLGYDPVEKHHKVLVMTYTKHDRCDVFEEIQVLTVGTRHWRMIECDTQHFSDEPSVCINGVLYYIAASGEYEPDSMVVCFDVRTEKFSFIKSGAETQFRGGTLINYNGKLASILCEGLRWYLPSANTSFHLWVLEDSKKQEWSKRVLFFPAGWKELIGNFTYLKIAGVTRTNEIVFYSDVNPPPLYLFYYHIERKTIVRVRIQDVEAFAGKSVNMRLHHVEDLKLM